MLNKSQSFQQDATILLPYFSSLVSIAPWQNANQTLLTAIWYLLLLTVAL